MAEMAHDTIPKVVPHTADASEPDEFRRLRIIKIAASRLPTSIRKCSKQVRFEPELGLTDEDIRLVGFSGDLKILTRLLYIPSKDRIDRRQVMGLNLNIEILVGLPQPVNG